MPAVNIGRDAAFIESNAPARCKVSLILLYMKKLATTLLLFATVASATAGGLMTNSNQSASFLRSIARGTSLDPDAVYNNPAGVVFMADGWHLGLTNQMAWQTRQTESTFAAFAQGEGNRGATKTFKGKVFSPIIPSFQLAWKKNRWAVMAGMGVNGGGGRVKYDDGLASFERQYAVLPTAVSALGQPFGLSADKYGMNMHFVGTLMTLQFQAGAAYRITDWLSASVLLRVGVTSNKYEGYMKDIRINPTCTAFGMTGQMIPATQFFQQVAGILPTVGMGDLAPEALKYAALTADHSLDVKQTGTSLSPVIALAVHKGKWDAAVKYEFKMPTEVKVKSSAASAADPVINGIFPDGTKMKSETPALLTVAASRWCGPVKITAEWHHYFDKDADNSFKQNGTVKGNTNEYLIGAEWQLSKRWLVSAGYQQTVYDLDAAHYSDMNFVTSSFTLGFGAAYQVSRALRLNLGTMSTFYDKVTNDLGNGNKDVYSRKNSVVGIGLDFKF